MLCSKMPRHGLEVVQTSRYKGVIGDHLRERPLYHRYHLIYQLIILAVERLYVSSRHQVPVR
ncbi:hypothetical protein J6590_076334 [Homalodisca vitripennis]|nr:hypothetical protein J6590_076334 [Homalodisca vitripennis]